MRLPQFLTALSPVRETLEALARGEEALSSAIAEKNEQLCVKTAGEGLSLWEADYGLPDRTGGDPEARRAAVLAAMAGGRTLTPAYLEELCRTAGGGDWGQVNEDFANWTVTAYAAAFGRIPAGAEALDAAVNRLKPAHLAVEAHPAGVFSPETERASALTGGTLAELTGSDALRGAAAHAAALTAGALPELSGSDALRGGPLRAAALTAGTLLELTVEAHENR